MPCAGIRRRPGMRIPGLAFSDLRFEGDPGQPAGAEELVRQANALGKFVTNPKYAECFTWLPGRTPAQGRRAGIAATRAIDPRRSPRCARRPSAVRSRGRSDPVLHRRPGRRALRRRAAAARSLSIPRAQVRYSIFKKLDSQNRQTRQLTAMRGPLKRFWKKTGRRFSLQPHVLRRLHDGSKG